MCRADLDYIGTVKLVNYIRSQVKTGNKSPDLSSKTIFQDHQFLQPVLEDDALLYSLDDLDKQVSVLQPTSDLERQVAPENPEADPEHANATLSRAKTLENDLKLLQERFSEHRTAVDRVLENRRVTSEGNELTKPVVENSNVENTPAKSDDDYYFNAYGAHRELQWTSIKHIFR